MTERPPLSRFSNRGLLEEILDTVDALTAGLVADRTDNAQWRKDMTDAFDDLATEVQEDIRDDAARDARIAELESSNAALAQTATDAIQRADIAEGEKATLQATVDEQVQKASDAVTALRSSDYPNAQPPAKG